jgi:hypothetical protein
VYGTDASFRHADAHIPVDTSKYRQDAADWDNVQFVAGSHDAAVYLNQPCPIHPGTPCAELARAENKQQLDDYQPDPESLARQREWRRLADSYRQAQRGQAFSRGPVDLGDDPDGDNSG